MIDQDVAAKPISNFVMAVQSESDYRIDLRFSEKAWVGNKIIRGHLQAIWIKKQG